MAYFELSKGTILLCIVPIRSIIIRQSGHNRIICLRTGAKRSRNQEIKKLKSDENKRQIYRFGIPRQYDFYDHFYPPKIVTV